MKVIAGPEVVQLIEEQGGQLYVWTDPHSCCSGQMTFLLAGPRPPLGRLFRRFDAEGFELWFDPGSMDPPDELHLDVKGRRKKRVAAYWNGCAFAI
jgi:hypothetical protein